MFSRYEKPNYEELREILSHLNYADRDQWYKTFNIVGREYPNDSTAFGLCRQWSSQYAGRKPEDERKEHEEFYNQSKRAGAGIGSLINQAKLSGYKPKRPHTEQIDPHGGNNLLQIMAHRMKRSVTNVAVPTDTSLKAIYGDAQKAAQAVLKFWAWDEMQPHAARANFMRRYAGAFNMLPKVERNYLELLSEYSQTHNEYSYDALVDWAEDNFSDFDRKHALAFIANSTASANSEASEEHIKKAIDLSWQLHVNQCVQVMSDYFKSGHVTKEETEQAIASFALASRPFNPQLEDYNESDIAPIGRMEFIERDDPKLSAMHFVRTGYDMVDRYIDGWRRGEPSIVAAHSGVGKTWFGVDACNKVVARGGSALFISTEMSRRSIVGRFYENASKLPFYQYQQLYGELKEKTLIKATEDAAKFYQQPNTLNIVYATDLSVIISAIEARNDAKPLDLIVIDYLQNIYNDQADHARTANWERVNSVMNEITRCANRNNVPILVLAQLNNPNRKAGNNQEPNLYDIADASGVVRDAAAVMVMYRVAVGSDSGMEIPELRCKIVKSRYGNLPETPLIVNRSNGSRFSFIGS